ncbi:MAG: N-acyl homoserine lactonase family protein [Ruminococcus sp.]|nr:N-acyl homoserine lactonase family protein [Ruminococcus sp.]
MKIQFINLGKIKCQKKHLIKCENIEEKIISPIYAVLFRHPILGNVLYDTGNASDYKKYWPQSLQNDYPIAELIPIEEGLKQKGITVNDIDMLIMSHLHMDHAGGIRAFAGTKAGSHIIISRSEYNNACSKLQQSDGSNASKCYIREFFYDIPGIGFHLIQDDCALADDFKIFIQQSHTPGVIGLIAGKNNPYIFTSDTVYTESAFNNLLPPGGSINATSDEFFDNIDKIKKLREETKGTIIFGHDNEQFESYYKKGEFEKE